MGSLDLVTLYTGSCVANVKGSGSQVHSLEWKTFSALFKMCIKLARFLRLIFSNVFPSSDQDF